MTKIHELHQQAAKAERLLRSVGDQITIERLMAFAAECRSQIETLTRPTSARIDAG